ncbi:hypothetical protein [Streptomyces diastaticus]|uniref:hypothetical protein n=1 Tax=Streptomyces diastaticus TaxID=1956 RepID=UPI00366895F8
MKLSITHMESELVLDLREGRATVPTGRVLAVLEALWQVGVDAQPRKPYAAARQGSTTITWIPLVEDKV